MEQKLTAEKLATLKASAVEGGGATAAAAAASVSGMAPGISAAHLAQLYDEGYCVFPNVVQPALVTRALRAVNQQLSRGISLEEAENFINGSCFEKLGHSSIITDLFTQSAAVSLVRSVIGDVHAPHGGQIALRFPGFQAIATDTGEMCIQLHWAHGWHIDGMGEKRKQGEIGNFTCLFGVFLEDVQSDFSGNLIVHPGGHHMMEQYFRTHGPADCERFGQSALPKDLPLPPPRMVKGRAGDAVMVHYLMPHSVAPNISPHNRYVVYFRLCATAHRPGQYRPDALSNAWLDWPGMQPFVAARRSHTAPGPFGYALVEAANVEAAQLRARADPLFDKHQWAEARPLYARLVELRPYDPVYLMKAGVCYTLPHGQTTPDQLRQGEAYLRQAIAYCAVFAPLYAQLARNLRFQERFADALQAVESMLQCAPLREKEQPHWTASVVDGMRVALECCAQLGQPHTGHALMARAAARFPSLAAHLDTLHKHGESTALWAQLKRFTEAGPHKDWLGMRPTAQRLAALHPDNLWAVAHAAMCFTYPPGRPQAEYQLGEQFAQQTIAADPASPVGYGLLARNAMQQRRPDAVLSVLEAMLSNVEAAQAAKHPHLSLDALRAAREAGAALRIDVRPLVDRFCLQFAALAPQARAVAVQADDPCRTM